jgi:DNA-directed RNA polymerase subunit E'/Rpb7
MQGKIRQDGSGLATYKVQYECVALRPFKGEVVDVVVESVSKVRALHVSLVLKIMLRFQVDVVVVVGQ